jgi:nitroreductase
MAVNRYLAEQVRHHGSGQERQERAHRSHEQKCVCLLCLHLALDGFCDQAMQSCDRSVAHSAACLLWPVQFTFFGAPVALIVTLDREMGPPQWSDVGMFMQTFMLLCREAGLHTCAQEAWANWSTSCAQVCGIPDNELVFRSVVSACCCIALR